MTTVDPDTRRYRRRTLLVFVMLQGVLYGLNPNLLPMWGDEANTVITAAQSPARIIEMVHKDVHPPLYPLTAHVWNRLPIGFDPLLRLRLLSALFAILTTIFIDTRWLKGLSTGARDWFLLFWVFSPFLLLYCRMARSYSLQAFLSSIALWYALRLVEDRQNRKLLLAFATSMTLLLYTHYVPGIAVWVGANTLLITAKRGRNESWRTWAFPNALVLIAYLPWMLVLAEALSRWEHKGGYYLTGHAWSEQFLKLGYWTYSFAFGEAIPIWLLPVTALLALPYLSIVISGARLGRPWLWSALLVAAAGYVGAAQWVSYPFVGGRLIFLLPLFVLALAKGIEAKARLGTILGVCLFGANVAGIWAYFNAQDILNIGYLAPSRRIAAEIVLNSQPDDSVVWIDRANFDGSALRYYLPNSFRVRALIAPESIASARAELDTENIRHVWLVRNVHDISPDRAVGSLQQALMATWHNNTLHPYVPVPLTDLAILRGLALLHWEEWKSPPRYAYEVWEFRRER